jgi:hypothetical protein
MAANRAGSTLAPATFTGTDSGVHVVGCPRCGYDFDETAEQVAVRYGTPSGLGWPQAGKSHRSTPARLIDLTAAEAAPTPESVDTRSQG